MHMCSKYKRDKQSSDRSPEVGCEAAHDISRNVLPRSTSSGQVLFSCVALAVLVVTTFAVKPRLCRWGPSKQLEGFDAVLAIGRIDSCSMPQEATPSMLANFSAALSIHCSYQLAQRHHGSSWTVQQQRYVPRAVPEHVLVDGLDALTCMVTKAAALESMSAVGMQQARQQRYVFLLRISRSGHGKSHGADPSYQLVEYAPLTATTSDAALSFLLGEWGAMASMSQLGCHPSHSSSSVQAKDSSTDAWWLGTAQQRHLLQAAANLSHSPEPNPAQTPEASPSPQPASAPVDSLPSPSVSAYGRVDQDVDDEKPTATDELSANTTTSKQAAAPAGDAPPHQSSDGSGQSSPRLSSTLSSQDTVSADSNKTANSVHADGTQMISNSTSTRAAANTTGSMSTKAPVRAAGPAEFQQQQALNALLADSNRLNSTRDGSPAGNKTSCLLSPATGPCRASIPRWAYAAEAGQCIEFTWGGCDGNDNRFETLQDCLATCSGVSKPTFPGLVGPVDAQTTSPAGMPAATSPAPMAPAAAVPTVAPAPEQPIATTILPDRFVGVTAGGNSAPAASAASHVLFGITHLGLAAVTIMVGSMSL